MGSIQQLCKIRTVYGEVCDKEQKELAKISFKAKKKYHGYTLRKSKPKGRSKTSTQGDTPAITQDNQWFLNVSST